MINKQNDNQQSENKEQSEADQPALLDIAHMDVQCHLIIEDVDTKEILVNKRG